MSNETLVYGIIEGATYTSEEYRKYQDINLKVIASLPEHDEYPYLSKSMFSAPGQAYDEGTYRAQAIHFGGSISGLEFSEIDIWIEKLESLLKRLYWFQAVAYIEAEMTGTIKYEWLPKLGAVSVHEKHGRLLPVTEWDRKIEENN